jgi:hypothetical protein
MHVRAAAAAFLAGETGWLILRIFPNSGVRDLTVALLALVLVGPVMVAVYIGLSRLMGLRQLPDLAAPLLDRLKPSKKAGYRH